MSGDFRHSKKNTTPRCTGVSYVRVLFDKSSKISESIMQFILQRALKRRFLITALILLLITPELLLAAQLVGDTMARLSGQALIQVLKQGGYVIYFRHGITNDSGEKDVEDKDLSNCSIQRNLSPKGQEQTAAIGLAFKTLQIPVSTVYSSPYCRCLDTAKNIFGKFQKSKFLHFAIHLDSAERDRVTTYLLELLGTVPEAGSNIAVVSHTANLQEAVGVWPKPEGVAHIFKPEGDEQFSYVGMMLPEAWSEMAASIIDNTRVSGEQAWWATVTQWLRHLFF